MRKGTSAVRTPVRGHARAVTALRLIEGGSRSTTLTAGRERPRTDPPLWLVPARDMPTVLIADADEDVLTSLGFALAGEFELIRAENGEQALRLALIERPDLVVLDARIPMLDGYRVTAQIRRNPATANTPVILLDTHPERIDVLRGFAAGANDYITKPLDPYRLLARIREVLQTGELVC